MGDDFSRITFSRRKHFSAVLMQQGRAVLDSDWNEQVAIAQHRERLIARDLIGVSGVPIEGGGFALTASNDDLRIAPGRIYVDGILIEFQGLQHEATYLTQPDYQAVNPQADGSFLAYLDVWERHIDAVEDPSLIDDAIGIDSSVRSKMVWQFKMWPVPEACRSQDWRAITNSKEWKDFVSESNARLSARSEPSASSAEKGGYVGAENQLYRVQIHQGGTAGSATVKWSRGNGSVTTSWMGQDHEDLMIDMLGVDPRGFAAEQWVEVTDLTRELQGQPGILVQVSDTGTTEDGPVLTIDPSTASAPIDFARFPRIARIIRWDNDPDDVRVPGGDLLVKENEWFELEDGVEIFFQSGGTYSTGDYWTIPARTAIGDVEWPIDDANPSHPIPQPPQGVHHHRCPIALASFSARTKNWTVHQDCRLVFSPVTSQGLQVSANSRAIHLTGTSWMNDDTFTSYRLQSEGLTVTFDTVPDPSSLSSSSVVVTIEQPGRAPILVEGPLETIDNKVIIKPLLREVNAQTSTRVRVTLKGAMIWSNSGGQLSYLDGQSFGRPALREDRTTGRIELIFPTGDGSRAGDFESWFWLVT